MRYLLRNKRAERFGTVAALAALYLLAGTFFVFVNVKMGGEALCPAPARPAITIKGLVLAPLAFVAPVADCRSR